MSGVAVLLGDTAIDWRSSTQKCVTTAACEESMLPCAMRVMRSFAQDVGVLQLVLISMRVNIFGDD